MRIHDLGSHLRPSSHPFPLGHPSCATCSIHEQDPIQAFEVCSTLPNPPHLHPNAQDPSGQGLFTTPHLRHSMRQRWLGRRLGALVTGQRTLVAAEVPLSLALTAETASQDPDLGQTYAELLQLGLLDERSVVVAMLTVEKLRGDESRYAPWIRMLPAR